MAILNNKSEVQQRSQQQIFATRYNTARHNILSVVIFTLINIILCVTNSGRYFLFSAFVPYMLVGMGMFECGLYPTEYYNENFPGMQFADLRAADRKTFEIGLLNQSTGKMALRTLEEGTAAGVLQGLLFAATGV